MNAPTTPAAVMQQNIAIDDLIPSPTNPRKRFDEAKLKELAESIKSQGVLQPILVRTATAASSKSKAAAAWPFPEPGKPKEVIEGKYEVISGERRYRAAKLAGLVDMPCFIRELTDLQVLHAQVIENLQRDDLHPIEEAEGYEKLMQQLDSKGQKYTADAIADEVGKSRSYVFGRLKLLALCTEARDAFYKGDLDASTALLIARIPVNKLQVQAVKKVTEKAQYGTSTHREGDVLMSYRTARDYIQNEFMLDLAKAPFSIKDAALIEKAGACTDCQKRTGNQPELFDDVKSKDVCTDTVCFGMKKVAHVLALQKEAEKNGNTVITGKDAKKIITNNGWPIEHQLNKAGLATLDDEIPDDAEGRTWGQVLKSNKLLASAKDTGKAIVAKTLVENPNSGALIETVNMEVAMKALREAGFEIKPISQSKKDIGSDKWTQQQDKEKAELERINGGRQHLFQTIRTQLGATLNSPQPAIPVGLYRIIAERLYSDLVEYADGGEDIAQLYLPDVNPEEVELVQSFQEEIPKMTPAQHFVLIMDTLLVNECKTWRVNDAESELMAEVAKELGIDPVAALKQGVEQAKAAQKAKADAAKKTAKEPAAKTPTKGKKVTA